MTKIGLMGCGAVASFGHLPAISQTEGLELVAVYDPSPVRLAAVSSEIGSARAFSDVESFFDSDMEAVVVCSPAWAHKENVLESAKRRIHVLCEKPIAMNDEDAEEMILAMEKAGKHLFTAFVYRFSPVALQIKKWVEEKIAGNIRSLRLVYDWELHGEWMTDSKGGWIKSPVWAGRMAEGGPLVDCGVHQIDLARWWLGEDVVATNAAGAWVSNYEAPDHVYLHMTHSGGASTCVETSFSYGHTAVNPSPIFTYDLIGDGGILHYNRNGWILEARNGQGIHRVPGASEKNFPGLHHAFSEALRTGDPGNLPSGRDGLWATKIARSATDLVIANRIPNG